MRLFKCFLFLLISSMPLLAPANPMKEIQQSHINAHLPNTFEDFNKIVERDLIKYFSGSLNTNVSVQYELLRKMPTQSGVSYPKFYAWVTLSSSEKEIESGAVRVAAIEKTHVEVTNFIPKQQIIENPQSIETVFPSSLCDSIRLRAGIK